MKRIYRAVGAFPNDQSSIIVAGFLLVDINEEWITSKKYLLMEDEVV
jgi:putative transposase